MKPMVMMFALLSLAMPLAFEVGLVFAEGGESQPAVVEGSGEGVQGGGADTAGSVESPDDPKARARKLYFSGMNLISHNRTDKAVEAFKEAIELNPGHYKTHLMLAKAYVGLDRYDDAISTLCQAVEIEPANPKAYDMTMQLYLYQNKPEKSLETAEAAIAAGVDAQALPDLGWTYYLVGRFDDAQSYFNKNIDLYGDSYGPYRNLGLLSFVRGDYAEALRYFKKAGEIDPENDAILYLYAVTYNRLGEKDKASRAVGVMKSRDIEYKKSIDKYEKRYFPHTDPGSLKNYIYMIREGAPGSAEAEDGK